MEEKDILDGVHLRYVSDKKPGITRKARGKSFIYYDKHGVKVTDEKIIDRINILVIPPAWKKVWVCQYKNGHMQATGMDNKGRKQYRYHQLWNELKQQKKFSHVLDFAESLPKIREQREKDLQLQGLPKEKVVATVVWLLENTMIRVGNDEYKEENNSYGLTTIANKHAKVDKSTITFSFVGKSGVKHKVNISHRKIANIVRRCQDLPGQDLFAYEGADGKAYDITSYDINEYLKQITGQDITAKDFRTWGGTVAAAGLLDEAGIPEKITESKKNIVTTVKSVAEHLRNRPATCKKYYIHPTIFEAYTNGYVVSNIREKLQGDNFKKIDGLAESENDVVCLLKIMLREGERNLHAKI
ncbi:MAG: DNA topoisomerase IB [Candidatus Levybacteria bacterium]|nr:DNA topoisomerase IB [Candidatus Levybacteria bacterium]